MNLIKIQDDLKNLSDAQLAQEMRMPSGLAPQFLVMSEMGRREKMRAEAASGQQAPQTSIAEEMVAQAQPQGIMGLPDETLAGAAMRARITGQQQAAPGVGTINPAPQAAAPQEAAPAVGMARGGYVDYMADGGSAQYGGLFKPVQQPMMAYPQSPVTQAPTFTAPIQPVAQPTTPAPIPQQVVPAERYGRHENPVGRNDIAGILANLTPEQRRRLDRLGVNLSGVGGVGGVGGTAGAAASGAAGVGAGGVGGAGVGGAGFAEGGPVRMASGDAADSGNFGWSSPIHNLTDAELSQLALGNEPTVTFDYFGNPTTFSREAINAETARRSENSPFHNVASGIGRSMRRGLEQARADRDEYRRRSAERTARDIAFFTEPSERGYGAEDPAYYKPPAPQGMGGGRGRMPGVNLSNLPDAPEGTPFPRPKPDITEIIAQPRGTPKSAPTSGMPSMGSNEPSAEAAAEPAAKAMRDHAADYLKQNKDLLDRLGGNVEEARDAARSNAIMKAGLAMMASKNPNFLAAVGEGATAGLGDWSEAKKDLRKEEIARAAAEMEAYGKAAQMGQAADISAREQAFNDRRLAAETALADRRIAAERALQSEKLAAEAPYRQAQIDAALDKQGISLRRDLVDQMEVQGDIYNAAIAQGDEKTANDALEQIQRLRDRLSGLYTIDYTDPNIQAGAAAALASRSSGGNR